MTITISMSHSRNEKRFAMEPSKGLMSCGTCTTLLIRSSNYRLLESFWEGRRCGQYGFYATQGDWNLPIARVERRLTRCRRRQAAAWELVNALFSVFRLYIVHGAAAL